MIFGYKKGLDELRQVEAEDAWAGVHPGVRRGDTLGKIDEGSGPAFLGGCTGLGLAEPECFEQVGCDEFRVKVTTEPNHNHSGRAFGDESGGKLVLAGRRQEVFPQGIGFAEVVEFVPCGVGRIGHQSELGGFNDDSLGAEIQGAAVVTCGDTAGFAKGHSWHVVLKSLGLLRIFLALVFKSTPNNSKCN